MRVIFLNAQMPYACPLCLTQVCHVCMQYVGGLSLVAAQRLSSLQGLSGLTQLHGPLNILYCPEMKDLSGLGPITSVSGAGPNAFRVQKRTGASSLRQCMHADGVMRDGS